MNLKPQQPLIGMIFTNADLKICWQIRLQARQRHCCDDGKSYRCNRFRCGVGGRVNMSVTHIGANGLCFETDSCGRA